MNFVILHFCFKIAPHLFSKICISYVFIVLKSKDIFLKKSNDLALYCFPLLDKYHDKTL